MTEDITPEVIANPGGEEEPEGTPYRPEMAGEEQEESETSGAEAEAEIPGPVCSLKDVKAFFIFFICSWSNHHPSHCGLQIMLKLLLMWCNLRARSPMMNWRGTRRRCLARSDASTWASSITTTNSS